MPIPLICFLTVYLGFSLFMAIAVWRMSEWERDRDMEALGPLMLIFCPSLLMLLTMWLLVKSGQGIAWMVHANAKMQKAEAQKREKTGSTKDTPESPQDAE